MAFRNAHEWYWPYSRAVGGTHLQSTGPTRYSLSLDLQDGGWIIKLMFFIIPMAVALSFFLNRPVWRHLPVGLLAAGFGVCLRVILLGSNAVFLGQNLAVGVLDDVIRVGVCVFVTLAMMSVGIRRDLRSERQGRFS